MVARLELSLSVLLKTGPVATLVESRGGAGARSYVERKIGPGGKDDEMGWRTEVESVSDTTPGQEVIHFRFLFPPGSLLFKQFMGLER